MQIKRVMRLVHGGGGEIDVVGRDQGQVQRIGQLDKPALGPGLGLGQTAALAGMALQLDVKPVGIGPREAFQQRLRLGQLRALQQPPQRPLGAAGQADQPLGMALQLRRR